MKHLISDTHNDIMTHITVYMILAKEHMCPQAVDHRQRNICYVNMRRAVLYATLVSHPPPSLSPNSLIFLYLSEHLSSASSQDEP